jgi:hypothetical protein
VVVPAAEALTADAIALLIANAEALAAKFTTAVLAATAVAALVAAATLVAAALTAAVTAAATPPTFVGVAVLELVFLLLELLEDSEVEADVVVLEEVPKLPELEPLDEELDVVLEVLLEVVLDPAPDPALKLDAPFALTGPAKTMPLANMVTPPLLPPVEDTEPFTVMACAVAVI